MQIQIVIDTKYLFSVVFVNILLQTSAIMPFVVHNTEFLYSNSLLKKETQRGSEARLENNAQCRTLMLTLVLCEGQTWNPVTRSNDIWGQDYIWEASCLQWSNSPSDKFYQREKSSCKQRIPFPSSWKSKHKYSDDGLTKFSRSLSHWMVASRLWLECTITWKCGVML